MQSVDDKTSQKHENITFRTFFLLQIPNSMKLFTVTLNKFLFYTDINMLAIKNSVEHLGCLRFSPVFLGPFKKMYMKKCSI